MYDTHDKDGDAAALLGPADLLELAGRQRWSAEALELEHDREQWSRLPAGLRERLLWHLGAFYLGEDSVAGQLDPLICACGDSAERAFLVSQRADEVRHAHCFDRLFAEVVRAGEAPAQRLAVARRYVGASVIDLLEVRLEGAAERLRADPGDRLAKVDFVTVYHLVIEGMLAITGQRMLLDFLSGRQLLAGWTEALRLIAADEHRHVAYGVWLLARAVHEPMVSARVTEQLRELVAVACAVLVPPGSRPELFRPLAWTGRQLLDQAVNDLRRRLLAIGLDSALVSRVARPD